MPKEEKRLIITPEDIKNTAVQPKTEQTKPLIITDEETRPVNLIRELIKQFLEQIKKERQDVENIFNQIIVHDDQSWHTTSENEIGEIEDNLIEQIVLPESEQASNYMKEQAELLEIQNQAIKALYGNRKFNTPIIMQTHIQQTEIGQNGYWSCIAVSTINALRALGITQPAYTETTIIEELGGKDAFTENGYLPTGVVYKFLTDKGLKFLPSGNIIELTQTLEKGGVAIIAYGGHAKLISGAMTLNGEVFFRINDPFDNKLKIIPSTKLVSEINVTKRFHNLYLIEKP